MLSMPNFINTGPFDRYGYSVRRGLYYVSGPIAIEGVGIYLRPRHEKRQIDAQLHLAKRCVGASIPPASSLLTKSAWFGLRATPEGGEPMQKLCPLGEVCGLRAGGLAGEMAGRVLIRSRIHEACALRIHTWTSVVMVGPKAAEGRRGQEGTSSTPAMARVRLTVAGEILPEREERNPWDRLLNEACTRPYAYRVSAQHTVTGSKPDV